MIEKEQSKELMTWELIERGRNSDTYRCEVPGGWLLRLQHDGRHPADIDYMFIADKSHSWGQDKI